MAEEDGKWLTDANVYIKCRDYHGKRESGYVVCKADFEWFYEDGEEQVSSLDWMEMDAQPFNGTQEELYDRLGELVTRLKKIPNHDLVRRYFVKSGGSGVAVDVFGRWNWFEGEIEERRVVDNFL